MHQKHHFLFMKRIVCSLYAGKRRLIRLLFSFIIYTCYNADFYSILYVNVLKQRFSILLTAWVVFQFWPSLNGYHLNIFIYYQTSMHYHYFSVNGLHTVKNVRNFWF